MPDKNRSAAIINIIPAGSPNMRIEVTAYAYTGTNPKTLPGVGIGLYSDNPIVAIERRGEPPYVEIPLGVIDRDQVRKLRNLLTDFLLDYPEEEPGQPGSS